MDGLEIDEVIESDVVNTDSEMNMGGIKDRTARGRESQNGRRGESSSRSDGARVVVVEGIALVDTKEKGKEKAVDVGVVDVDDDLVFNSKQREGGGMFPLNHSFLVDSIFNQSLKTWSPYPPVQSIEPTETRLNVAIHH